MKLETGTSVSVYKHLSFCFCLLQNMLYLDKIVACDKNIVIIRIQNK